MISTTIFLQKPAFLILFQTFVWDRLLIKQHHLFATISTLKMIFSDHPIQNPKLVPNMPLAPTSFLVQGEVLVSSGMPTWVGFSITAPRTELSSGVCGGLSLLQPIFVTHMGLSTFSGTILGPFWGPFSY